MNIIDYEKLNPRCRVNYRDKVIQYCTPNSVTHWRASTLFTKEPDTVAWISDEFRDGDMFVDIGANVGMYTILAASLHDLKVLAFEPESQNFALLCKNVVENNLQDRVTAYPIGLSDREGVVTLSLSSFGAGLSGHGLNGAAGMRQGVYSTTLNKLVYQDEVIPPPNHIKIDVDGLEPNIIAGAYAALTDRRLRSVLVEIDRKIPAHAGIIGLFEGIGFQTDAEQMDRALRKDGPCKGVGNVIFRRNKG